MPFPLDSGAPLSYNPLRAKRIYNRLIFMLFIVSDRSFHPFMPGENSRCGQPWARIIYEQKNRPV
jgi:hypothetical protein